MMPTTVTVEPIHQAAEVVVVMTVAAEVVVMAVAEAVVMVAAEAVTDLWDKTSASNVVDPDTGLVIAHQQAVMVAEAAAGSPPARGLVAVVTAMLSVNVMWTIDMMEGVLGIENAMTVEIASLAEAVVDMMLMTGTCQVEEIGLKALGMDSRTVTHHHHRHHHQLCMTGRETMIGKLAQGGAVTDTAAAVVVEVAVEGEDLHGMKEETTGKELVRMTALEGEEAARLLLTIDKFVYCLVWVDEPFCMLSRFG